MLDITMAYLRRRIESLLADLDSGRLIITPGAQGMRDELAKVRKADDGQVDLHSVTPALRSMVRAAWLAMNAGKIIEETSSPEESVDSSTVSELSRELFTLLEDVFTSATGVPSATFPAERKALAAAIRASGSSVSGRRSAISQSMENLQTFYRGKGLKLFSGAKQLAGFKVVHGGQQSYTGTSFDATCSMGLYADAILIADPVARWFEGENSYEAYKFPRMLEDIRHLLRLRGLVDANLPYPAIVVFPSFEKWLENNDDHTQDAMEMMFLQFWGHFLGARFEDLEEVFEFSAKCSDDFISKVVKFGLLVPGGGDGSESFADAIAQIRNADQRMRSEEYRRLTASLPDSTVALMSILERLGPQYHMLENSRELGGSPLMALDVHWKYFGFLQQASVGMMQGAHCNLNAQAFQTVAGGNHRWLGNVPFDTVVEMRERGENEAFRELIGKEMAKLRQAEGDDIQLVVAQVDRALNGILRTHDRELEALTQKYAPKYAASAVGAWVTLAASFLPLFPALTPIAATAVGGAYLSMKASELVERRQLKNTLTGILASSARR